MRTRIHRATARGFSLIEILIVIGIIGILATIVLVAINPSRQFSQANNTQRESNVAAVLSAVSQYVVDNKGVLPPGVGGTAAEISEDLCNALVPTYIPAIPSDPASASNGASYTACADVDANDIEYEVRHDANNRITVSAPNTEDVDPDGTTPVISLTR